MPQYPEMTREDFIAFILEHTEKPRNYREMPDATVSHQGGNPGCGDLVTMYLKVGEGDKIEDVSFTHDGCTISKAGASFMTNRLKGKTVQEIEEMDFDLVTQTFGREVMATRPRCATLGLSTAKTAAKIYRDSKRREDIAGTGAV